MRQRIRFAIIFIFFLFMPAAFYYFSPYLIIMGAAEKVISGSFIVFGALFILSLFLGRVFCGWLCPIAGLQETCLKIRNRKVNNRYNWVRYIIWVPWMGIIIYTAVSAGGLTEINFTYQTEYGISVSSLQSMIMYYMVLIPFVVISLAAGNRAVCHYVCWMSPFMIAGRKIRNLFRWPSLRLKANKENCRDCLECNKACSMSLDVHKMVQAESMENSECILCGSCVDTCPRGVICYSFSRGK